jgi:RNA polymerase sigma-70 factor (ECF subfamily)
VEDLDLARACAAGDPAAIATFEQRLIGEIGAFLARVERNPAVVDEVRQLVRARLLVADGDAPPRIAEYTGAGRLASWVRVVALRTHANLLRGQRRHDELDEDTTPAALAPELAMLRDRHRADVEAALRAAFGALAPRDRTLLRMHYLDGVTLDKVAAIYAAHRATVARWLAAARARVVDAATADLQARLGLGDDELSTWFSMMQSGLALSLAGLLASTR